MDDFNGDGLNKSGNEKNGAGNAERDADHVKESRLQPGIDDVAEVSIEDDSLTRYASPIEGDKKKTEDGTRSGGSETFEPILNRFDKERKEKKRMETLIILGVTIAVLIVLIAVFFSVKKHRDNKDRPGDIETGSLQPGDGETSAIMPPDVSITFAPGSGVDASNFIRSEITTKHEKPEEKPPLTNTPKPAEKGGEKTNSSAESIAKIASFFNKKFYLKGTMVSGGENNRLDLAIDGDNLEAYTDIDGRRVGIMRHSGKTYIIDPGKKTYIEMNSAMMKMMGIDPSEMELNLGGASFDATKPESVLKTSLNSVDAVAYLYRDGDGGSRFVTVNDEIREIDILDSAGNVNATIFAEKFVGKIPDGMLTLDGYTKQGMLKFFGSMMG